MMKNSTLTYHLQTVEAVREKERESHIFTHAEFLAIKYSKTLFAFLASLKMNHEIYESTLKGLC